MADELVRALNEWIGEWPPPTTGVTVIGSPDRDEPGWDGTRRELVGVSTPDLGTVLSVSPSSVDAVRALGETLDEIRVGISKTLDKPDSILGAGVFRTTMNPTRSPGEGVWLPRTDPLVPEWLHPFNGDVLVALAPGKDGPIEVAAGVGIKKHNAFAHEVAVVTEEDHRGKGLARSLVCQAAERILDDGAVPIYLHGEDNLASAKTADSCGFFDEGWRFLGLFPKD